mmetsp:Transcript_28935/g.84465  ORF Transcript_28935/g.84465 Transcript_28935/m.84465 type:complete len:80 (+) Transcript_28935:1368-1607(+)
MNSSHLFGRFLEKYGDEFVQDRSREVLMFSQHKGGWLKRIKPRVDASTPYSVDVLVKGGRLKTYTGEVGLHLEDGNVSG